MPVETFEQGEAFVYRVAHYWYSNPALRWHTTYEARAIRSGTLPDLLAAGNAMYAFERACALPVVMFDQLSIGTWTPDSVPYDPQSFVTYNLGNLGTRAASGEAVQAETAVFVRKSLLTGRQGRAIWRGNLVESDVAAAGGLPVLIGTAYATTFNAAKVSSNIADHFRGGTAAIRFASITRTGDYTREVTDMVIAKIQNVNMNHRYFDVGKPGATGPYAGAGTTNVFGETVYGYPAETLIAPPE